MSGHSTVAISPPVSSVGVSTPVSVKVENPHGVRRVHAYIEQNGAQSPLLDTTREVAHASSGRATSRRKTFTFDAGKNKAPNLKEGKARLVVEAVSNDLRGSTDSTSADVNVVLTPPRVIPDDAQHYINQGGMELVTFNATGLMERGRREGRQVHLPQLPAAGQGPGAAILDVRVFLGSAARHHAAWSTRAISPGTEATGHFWFKLFPQEIPHARCGGRRQAAR